MDRVKVVAISGASGCGKTSIVKYLENYEDHFRNIYIEKANQVRNNCDLIIQEICPVSVTADIVTKWLKSKANQ